MTHTDELTAIMRRLGAQALWRPLDLVEELLQHKDPRLVTEPLARSLLQVDFAGKSVVELGSNIGFYSFLAALLGAQEVHALDFGPDIVRLGELLAQRHGMPQVRFVQADFAGAPPSRVWDVALLLDIIGHNKVRKGRVGAILDILLRHSHKELVLNVRPVYEIEAELGVSPQSLEGLYPQEHLRQGRLHLLDYVVKRLGADWTATPLASETEMAQQDKPGFLFQRR